jgi:hypothetical protein
MRASGSFRCAWTRRPNKPKAAPSSHGICKPASSPYAWVAMLQSSVTDGLAPVAALQAARTPRTSVLNEGEASAGAMTEPHWRFASALYQSLLPSIGDSAPRSTLSDVLPDDEDVLPDDGDVLPDDGDVLPDDGDVLPDDGDVESAGLGPREETQGTVSGG